MSSNKKYPGALKVFIIAGEASGDVLGGKLMHSIHQLGLKTGVKTSFFGIGGEKMRAEGIDSIFPMEELNVMGIMEVFPHIPKLLRRINQTAHEIYRLKPDVVITVDAPDFSFRVIKKLRKLDVRNTIKKAHMIAPSVWAYRPKRAEKIAKLYDLLLAILPFEPPFFTKYGLKTKFIGHPIVENEVDDSKIISKEEFCAKYSLPVTSDIICVTPGSRETEILKLLPVFIDTVCILNKAHRGLSIGISTTYKYEDLVREKIKKLKMPVAVITSPDDKEALYRLSKVGIAKSGTNTFELLMAKLPIVVAYKFNFLTAFLGHLIVKVKYCNLINITLGHELIPEFVQANCKPELIAAGVDKLINNEKLIEKQQNEVNRVLTKLGRGRKYKSSDIAAQEIFDICI